MEIASHSYDETNMRTRTIEEVEQGREKDYYDTLHLHNVVSYFVRLTYGNYFFTFFLNFVAIQSRNFFLP